MPTKPFKVYYLNAGDPRMRSNLTRAEALHTWLENEGIQHRSDISGLNRDTLTFTLYITDPAQLNAIDTWWLKHQTVSC